MNVFRSYQKTRTFLWMNIMGLSIGLAVSIMLILFVVNELSYDKHFANADRIVRLNSTTISDGKKEVMPINLRKAYTEIPEKVPGIEAAVQIMNPGEQEVLTETKTFRRVNALVADPEFFKVFHVNFIAGNPETALTNPRSVVLTERQAKIIFGNAPDAIGKPLKVAGRKVSVSAVVEEFPANTHFKFDIIGSIEPYSEYGGLEYHTFYLIEENVSLPEVRDAIALEYSAILKERFKSFSDDAYGSTEMLKDIYLRSEAEWTLGSQNEMNFVWMLSAVALFILLLAVTNFINLFIAQGESRMKEIGVRKTNGATRKGVILQFLKEVTAIVFIAFAVGIILTWLLTPYFAELIGFPIYLSQLANPLFIVSIVGLFVATVIFSASYPAFYLSRFSPLQILSKRVSLSKRKLTVAVVVFQSAVTIIFISLIFVLEKQTRYLQDIPLGYNPENVVIAGVTKEIRDHYEAVKHELTALPQVSMVAGAEHIVGGGVSGQAISLIDNPDKGHPINEYRVMPGVAEIMELQLVEGEFIREDKVYDVRPVVINETAAKKLGLEYPMTGTRAIMNGSREIIGVVRDFYYDDPAKQIEPIVLSTTFTAIPWALYIKLNEDLNRAEVNALLKPVFRKFDPDYFMSLTWTRDVYERKFEDARKRARIISIGSLLSLVIAIIGLVATHLYTTVRRTKEIGVRRVNGASRQEIFALLTRDIVIWMAIAGVIAIPIVYYVASEWLGNYDNHTNLSLTIFILPILLQCIIAILVTSGVTIRVLSQNPVDMIRSE